MFRFLLFVVVGACLVFQTMAEADEETFELIGFAGVRGGWVEGQPGWMEGGFGRLSAGGDGPGDSDFWGRGEAQFGFRWNPSLSWQAKVHAVGRVETASTEGDNLGLTEAWARYRRAVGERSELMLKGGMFFYPSSQENIDPLWGSPYTLTYSAVNSWFAEEFRPIGLDMEWQTFTEQGDIFSLGATAFGGNDTLGTLIAWRGWAMHDRLTGLNETLPLPPNFSLEPGVVYGQWQNPQGTTPFGSDLDDRPGWATRVRFDRPGDFSVQLAWVDNQGDRWRYGDEWAWRTRFGILGTHWQVTESFELMGEWTSGNTRMDFPGMPWVNADFRAAYLMGSWVTAAGRFSLRHDRFTVDDKIRDSMWGIFDDRGHAWTLAWIAELTPNSRFGVELLWLDSDRTVAAQSGFSADTDGMTVMGEWRFVF